MKTEDDDDTISPSQKKLLIETFFYIHKIISRRLGRRYHSSLEDLKQKVFLKLWRWKRERTAAAGDDDKDLSAEEWQKLAHTAAVNEVIDFLRKKITATFLFRRWMRK